MEKKQNIVKYRERLDRTLASPDLTNDEILKKLVRSQLILSSEQDVEGFKEKVVETKTAEVSNFLDMLRSASSDDCGRSNASHTNWKLKQDSKEFRVMYREGPEGTPFHTLLVEGFVDAPVDICLCISWEASLYKKWWPQTTVPTFKILSSECLHKVRVGEQLSLVRVKVSWPLSTREAVVHYYLFEYFQDGLIVVLTNSVPDSKSVTETLCGFSSEAIPEAKEVVRVDLVGGFALQKVTSERSYFRTIAHMDIKLDFVPPSLINFISRQLIGNGFRLYQKVVASMMSNNKEEFSKVLKDPLYARIREALYRIKGSETMNGGEFQQVTRILPVEDLVESKQGGEKDLSKENKSNQCANGVFSMTMNAKVQDNNASLSEIVEVEREVVLQIEEDDKNITNIVNEKVDTSVPKGKKSVYIRSEVEQALETLDKAISMVREYRLHSLMAPSSANGESSCMKKDGRVDSYSAKLVQLCSNSEVSIEVPYREGASQEVPGTNSGIQNLRYTGTNSNSKEVNSIQIVPTSSVKNLSSPTETTQVTSRTLENVAVLDQTSCSNKQLNGDSVQDAYLDDADKSRRQKKLNTVVTQSLSSDVPEKLRRQKKYLYCCFHH